jgi:hypothetical protein
MSKMKNKTEYSDVTDLLKTFDITDKLNNNYINKYPITHFNVTYMNNIINNLINTIVKNNLTQFSQYQIQ